PRMRFDIVLNNLAGFAHTTKEIRMLSDGTPWRPLVHGLDIAKAIACSLEAPRDVVHDQIFNVGDTRHNYQVREAAQIVAETFPGCQWSFGERAWDNRSYRVSFAKTASTLPGFGCEWDASRGAGARRAVFERIDLTTELFESRLYTRLKMLKHLLKTGQIDENFYWLDARSRVDGAAAAGQTSMPAEALEAGA